MSNKANIELNIELENESYKVQVKELELDGRDLFVRGIVLDIHEKEAFEFEDSIDLSDFCWKSGESVSFKYEAYRKQDEQDIETSGDIK